MRRSEVEVRSRGPIIEDVGASRSRDLNAVSRNQNKVDRQGDPGMGFAIELLQRTVGGMAIDQVGSLPQSKVVGGC